MTISTLQAQFSSTGGPIGDGIVEHVYAFGDTAFIDLNFQPWRSFDGGQTWEDCTNNLPMNVNPDAFVKRGNVIYMGTNSGDRVYKSNDFGDSWEVYIDNLPTIIGQPSAVPSHLVRSGDRVFLGGTNFGLRYTDLADTSWIKVNEGAGEIVNSISVVGEDSLLVSQGTGFTVKTYFSSDNGDTWNPIGAEPNPTFTIAATGYGKIGDVLVATTDAGGVNTTYYSTDFGDSWQVSNGGPAIGQQLLQVDKDLIFTINFSSVYCTKDGINWTDLGKIGSGSEMAYWKGGHLLIGSIGNGLRELSDAGSGDEECIQTQLAISRPIRLLSLEDALYCLTARGVFSFNGDNWTLLQRLDSFAVFDVLQPESIFDLNHYNGTFNLCTNKGYYKSEDRGQSFQATTFFQDSRVILSTQEDQFEVVVTAVRPNNFDPRFINALVYYFDSNTNTYVQASLDGSSEKWTQLPQYSFFWNNTLYLSTSGKTFYKSTDFGKTWTSITVEYNVGRMHGVGSAIYFNSYEFPTGGIRFTSDEFTSATRVDLSGIPRGNDFLDWWYFEDIFVLDGQIYVYQNDPILMGQGNGWYSYNISTQTWTTLMDSELPSAPNALVEFEGALYASVPAWSVWSNKAITTSLPTSPSLSQKITAFPNPTNGLLNLINPNQHPWYLFNPQGQAIRSGRSQSVDLQDLPNGSYWLQLDGHLQQIIKVD